MIKFKILYLYFKKYQSILSLNFSENSFYLECVMLKKIVLALSCALVACQPMPSQTIQSNSTKALNKENNQPNQETTMTITPKDCKSKLHRVTDRDDLIRQIYETAILEDCLYSMSTKELQAIWDIPVLTVEEERQKYPSKKAPTLEPVDIHSRLGLYVVRSEIENAKFYTENFNTVNLTIRLNLSSFEKQRTLFLEGNFPEFLGTPIVKEFDPIATTMRYPIFADFHQKYGSRKSDFIQGTTNYYWNINNRQITAGTYIQPIITKLIFSNRIVHDIGL